MKMLDCKSRRYFYRVLQDEIEGGNVFKKPGPGNSYYYTANKTLKNFKTLEESPVPDVEIPRIEVHARNVRSLLKNWSEAKWNPKIFNSAQYLPLGIARLFGQVSEVMYGGKVTKAELMDIKNDLEVFKKDLISTSTTLFSLLETEDLWDPDTFFKFLMSEDAPPVDLIQDWIHKLKEHYQ